MNRLQMLRRRQAPETAARLHLALTLGALAFAVFTLLRLTLLTALATPGAERGRGDIALALASGALRDLGVAFLFAFFFVVVLNLKKRPFAKKWTRGSVYVLVALGLFLLFFSAIAEVLFWNEFDSRLDGIALYYLMFPREVIGNLQQSFNIALYMPMVIAAAIAGVFLLRQIISRALDHVPAKGARPREIALALLAVLVFVPLGRALPADISANREINQLGENGWRTLVSAALTNDQEYDGVYPTMDEQEAIRVTRGLVAQSNTTFIDPDNIRSIRRLTNNGDTPKKLNIVIVTNESFGSKFITVLDNRTGKVLTPNLDRLSKESLFFTNIYASGDRTVRGLEATETAFTPIPGISTARRAESKDMYSLPYLLKSFGYRSAVLYGGHAIFDNMGAYWKGIGFDPVWDQSDIRHDSFTTAWGVSDEDLYTEALQRMDEMSAGNKPFLLTMMTVSNHRPYRFPENHIRFDPAMTARENSARYADWAYGDFIERAKAHKWFDNTVFVFVADHSEKINGAAQVPLQDMRIPILIYAPKHIAPKTVATLGAQIDLIPTLLGELGFSYVNPFFGKDLLRVPADGGWSSTAHNFSIAFARPGHVAVLRPSDPTKGYAFEPGLKRLTAETPDPETAKEATALTQTAHHMFYAHQYHMPDNGLWPQYKPAVVAHAPAPTEMR